MENTFSYHDWFMGRQRFSNIYDVHAPPEAVWEVLTDIPSYPQTFREVQSMENMMDINPIRVGTKFSQQVAFLGARFTIHSTVTNLEIPNNTNDDDDFPRSISIAATHGNDFKDMASTETNIIQRHEDDPKNRTTWIFITVQQFGGVWDRLKLSMLSCCLYRTFDKTYETMSRDVEKASIARATTTTTTTTNETKKKQKKKVGLLLSSENDFVDSSSSSSSTTRSFDKTTNNNNREKKNKDDTNVETERSEDIEKLYDTTTTTPSSEEEHHQQQRILQQQQQQQIKRYSSSTTTTPVSIINLTAILQTRKKLSEQGLSREEIDHLLPILVGDDDDATTTQEEEEFIKEEEENHQSGQNTTTTTDMLCAYPSSTTQQQQQQVLPENIVEENNHSSNNNPAVIVDLTSILQKRKKLAEYGVSPDRIDLVAPIFSTTI